MGVHGRDSKLATQQGLDSYSVPPEPHLATPHTTQLHSPTLQVVDLKAEVARLKGQLEDSETARASAVTAAEALRDAAVERQEELSEDLRRARQAAERLTVSEEDAVIAVEKDMRAKHEQDVAVLRERASKAEARVRKMGGGGGNGIMCVKAGSPLFVWS